MTCHIENFECRYDMSFIFLTSYDQSIWGETDHFQQRSMGIGLRIQ